MLDTIFDYYLEQRGWLLFVILPSIIFLLMLIDNQVNRRNAIGWLAGALICLLLFVPAMIYDLGPSETREALRDVRLLLFYIGILGLIVPIMLVIGYWFSYRNQRPSSNNFAQPPMGNTPSQEAMTQLDGAFPTMPNQAQQGNPVPGYQQQYGNPVVNNQPQYGNPPAYQQQYGNPVVNNLPQYGNPAPSPVNNAGNSPAYADGGEAPTVLDSKGVVIVNKPQGTFASAWLVSLSSQNSRIQLRKGSNTIGRGSSFDIDLRNDTISRRGHATIMIDEQNSATIRDLGGAQAGVQVNGIQIHELTELHHKYQITLGEVKFEFLKS